MFLNRQKELDILRTDFSSKDKSAILVYGKRRIGKSKLIHEAAKGFDGVVIDYLCVRSSLDGNKILLSQEISRELGLPKVKFDTVFDIFDYLSGLDKKILVIIDEYQYLKESAKKGVVDSYMQKIIDNLSPSVKIVLCGSYISVMKELIEESNPLFGRFTQIIHLSEFDYYESADFFPGKSPYDQVGIYAVFGGSPYVLDMLNGSATLRDNLIKYLIPSTGVLRTYIESIMLREIQTTYDVRILEALANGKKKYTEISNRLGYPDNGALDKQLKALINMETIKKAFPINRPNDKKKTFYEINDNLMRFYFSFIFGNDSIINKFGEEYYYDNCIDNRLKNYISLRFEQIAAQYLIRKVRDGVMKKVTDIGTYWYDDPINGTNGQFDCVVQYGDKYDFYECKYYEKSMTKTECDKEYEQVMSIPGLKIRKVCFVSISGFDYKDDKYILTDGKMLYK